MVIDRQPGRFVYVAALCISGLISGVALAETEAIRCPDIKDVWISSIGQEVDNSMGRTEKLKLKVLQEMAIMGFDLSALKGRAIESADLYIHPAETLGPMFVNDRPHPLRWIAVSTISSHWVEGNQDKDYQSDPEGQGATYNEASYQTKPWAWPGSHLSFVINGHLNSIGSVGELTEANDGYWKVPVDAKVVQALVAELGDGLVVMDGSGTYRVNAYIYSRESKDHAPYLLVQAGPVQPATQAAPEIISVEPDLAHATPAGGAVVIKIKTPPKTFGFHVKIDGRQVEPWQIELPGNANGIDVITLEDLPAGKEVTVAVAAVDAMGNLSQWSQARGQVSPGVEVPMLPKSPFEPKAGQPVKAGKDVSVWAFPEMVEVDPVSGLPLFEKDKQGYRLANPVWSGEQGKIRLPAAQGEIAAFQLALEHSGQVLPVRVAVELKDPDGKPLPDANVHLWRIWYVKADTGARSGDRQLVWCPEYAIPMISPIDVVLRGPFDYDPLPPSRGLVEVPSSDNSIPGQKLQAVYVDIVVPPDARPGLYQGAVHVSAPDGKAELPLEVQVYPVAIPAELNFNPELDCYYSPGGISGSKAFFDYHRLAHYNRNTINEVSHTQTGQVWQDMIPKLAGTGADTHVADWSGYDKRIGPLLDGTAFAGLPRDGVPVRAFYLPFFENWPMQLDGHYEMGMPPAPPGRPGLTSEDPPISQASDDWKEIHDLKVKPIEQAFDEAYKKGFENVTTDFVKHFDQKGWTRTYIQMYQNNKYNHHGQWWTLDEPTEWADWAALGFWARHLHKGMAFPHKAMFLYRGDISRLQWQGNWMDGLMDVAYSGGSGLKWPRLLRHLRERIGMMLSIYGSCNPVGRNNMESAAWCLKAYSVWADGVLPWASLGRDHALFEPDGNGLLVDGGRFRVTAVPSLRVMAMRHGAQQCELLRQVVQANAGWSRWHAAKLVSQRVPLISDFRQRFADEAAAALFSQLSGAGFMELKEGLLQMLSATETKTAGRKPSGNNPSRPND